MTKKTMFLTLAALLSLAPHVFAEASIYSFEGKASVRRENTVYQADYDMPCQPNDIIRSDKDGYVDITMKSFVGTRMIGSTECQLAQINTSNRLLKLNYGTLMVNLKPLSADGSYKIETPTIIVSVEGAQFTSEPKNYLFLVDYIQPKEGKPYNIVMSRQGTVNVFVKESHTGLTVIEGRMVRVEEDAFAPTARNASDEEMERLAKSNSIYITED